MPTVKSGPLAGLRVIEFAGLGPGPFACMLLSDMGAEVVAVRRAGQTPPAPADLVNRGRINVSLDLKQASDVQNALNLIDKADVLIEGFRPGVMEKLGLGPDAAMTRNPRLIYGRMTGWGQNGPLAQAAGHDINYVAISGALNNFRAANGEVVSPLNLVGDYGGGALYLIMGVLAALYEREKSGHGQIIDAAMCDGAASLLTMFHAMRHLGFWGPRVRTNMLDGGAPYYRVYETKDGKSFSLGSIEPQFYNEFLTRAGIQDPDFLEQNNRARWPEQQAKLEDLFRTKTRQEWADLLEGGDCCAMSVLSLTEAAEHPHLQARQTFVERHGFLTPAPAPRFSRTPSKFQDSEATTAAALADVWSALGGEG